MATQVNVGTVGTPTAGQAPQPGNVAQNVSFIGGQELGL